MGSRGRHVADTPNHEVANEPWVTPCPVTWPPDVHFLTYPLISPYLTNKQLEWLLCKPSQQSPDSTDAGVLPIIRLPHDLNNVHMNIEIRVITNEKHPACGQFGLFATRHIGPEELILPYIGYVHSSTVSEQAQCKSQQKQHVQKIDEVDAVKGAASESARVFSLVKRFGILDEQSRIPIAIGSWDASSYDLNLHRDEDMELAIDAAAMGNEARFCNDYRGVPADTNHPGLQRNKQWERKAKRSAKSWYSENKENYSGIPQMTSNTPAQSIPNAEFRDVWLEWSMEDIVSSSEQRDTNHSVQDGQDSSVQENLEKLSLEQSTHREELPDTKVANRRKERRRKSKKAGMRGVAIFVLPAGKSGKRKGGIPVGQEILVSYGKGFWAHHKETAS